MVGIGGEDFECGAGIKWIQCNARWRVIQVVTNEDADMSRGSRHVLGSFELGYIKWRRVDKFGDKGISEFVIHVMWRYCEAGHVLMFPQGSILLRLLQDYA